METITKVCARCKSELDKSEFYKIRGSNSYVSYCKSCMKAQSRSMKSNKDYEVPYVKSEQIAIDYLSKHGIPALPGKTIRKSFVDVIAFGCVRIEVKYSKLHLNGKDPYFAFQTTPAQRERGFLGDIVMLICDYGDKTTYHFFPVSEPAFYMNDRMKTGIMFTPGFWEARKFGATRTVLVQGTMNDAQDRIELVHSALRDYCEALKRGA